MCVNKTTYLLATSFNVEARKEFFFMYLLRFLIHFRIKDLKIVSCLKVITR